MIKADEKTAFVFVALLACLPVVAAVAPRFLAYGPSLIAMALYVVYGIKNRQWHPQNMPALWAVLTVVGLAATSALWSIEPDITLERSGKMLLVLLPGALGLGALPCLPAASIRKWLWLIPASVTACLSVIYIELLFNMPLYRLLNGMGMEAFANPSNLNRPTVTAALSFFIALAILRERQHFIFIALLLALMLAVLSLTQSQSAIIAMLTGILFFTAMPTKSRTLWVGLFTITVLLIACAPVIGLYIFDYAEDLKISSLHDFFANSYAAERLEIWHFISVHILKQPWFGYGIESTRTIIFDTQQLYHQGNSVLHPHNFALQIWIEFGLIGIILACALLYRLLNYIRQHTDAVVVRAEVATLYAAFAVAAVAYGMWQGWWLGLLILLFFYAGLFRVARQAEAA